MLSKAVSISSSMAFIILFIFVSSVLGLNHTGLCQGWTREIAGGFQIVDGETPGGGCVGYSGGSGHNCSLLLFLILVLRQFDMKI